MRSTKWFAISVLPLLERLLIFTCVCPDKIRDSYLSSGVAEEMLKLLKRSKNAMVKWLAVDVIEIFASSGTPALLLFSFTLF